MVVLARYARGGYERRSSGARCRIQPYALRGDSYARIILVGDGQGTGAGPPILPPILSRFRNVGRQFALIDGWPDGMAPVRILLMTKVLRIQAQRCGRGEQPFPISNVTVRRLATCIVGCSLLRAFYQKSASAQGWDFRCPESIF